MTYRSIYEPMILVSFRSQGNLAGIFIKIEIIYVHRLLFHIVTPITCSPEPVKRESCTLKNFNIFVASYIAKPPDTRCILARALNMEMIRSYETSVHMRNTGRYTPGDVNIHYYRCENLQSRTAHNYSDSSWKQIPQNSPARGSRKGYQALAIIRGE
jgi:hypothetical protein